MEQNAQYTAAVAKQDMVDADEPGVKVYVPDGPAHYEKEHAYDHQSGQTFCGIEKANLDLARHLWHPNAPFACHQCRDNLGNTLST